jgi:hypothetical protein
MDPRKLQGVADWQLPKTPTDIRKFLWFTGYYRYFIPNYSKITRPLLDLTKKGVIWNWGPRQFKAFEELKMRMCKSPVLMQPDFNKHFYLQTDASAYGVGAVLSQEGRNTTPSVTTTDVPLLIFFLPYLISLDPITSRPILLRSASFCYIPYDSRLRCYAFPSAAVIP